jgi:hypothetical protein
VKTYSGFHGKGYKFDEMEEQLAAERKKAQKAALGLQDSDDEDGGVDVSKYYSTAVKVLLFVGQYPTQNKVLHITISLPAQ